MSKLNQKESLSRSDSASRLNTMVASARLKLRQAESRKNAYEIKRHACLGFYMMTGAKNNVQFAKFVLEYLQNIHPTAPKKYHPLLVEIQGELSALIDGSINAPSNTRRT